MEALLLHFIVLDLRNEKQWVVKLEIKGSKNEKRFDSKSVCVIYRNK